MMHRPTLLIVLGLFLLTFVPSQSTAYEDDSTISLNVVVMDKKGAVVTDIKPEDFRITVGNAPAEILAVDRNDGPLSIGILLDTSTSATDYFRKDDSKRGKKFVEGLMHFLRAGNSANEYFLLGFSSKPELLLDWTSDPERLLASFKSVAPRGATAMFDACSVAVQKVAQGRHQRRLLILIGDGQDTVSKSTFVQTRELFRHSNVPLYSLALISDNDLGSSLGMEGAGVLTELSETTGVRSLAPLREKPNDFVGLFDQIAREVSGQYIVKVAPAQSLKVGKWHKVSMKVSKTDPTGKRNNLSVVTRQGIYKD